MRWGIMELSWLPPTVGLPGTLNLQELLLNYEGSVVQVSAPVLRWGIMELSWLLPTVGSVGTLNLQALLIIYLGSVVQV